MSESCIAGLVILAGLWNVHTYA